jgi:beta-phosphoglucomutase-like phosphatase (HAD superfamily)
VKAKAPPTIFSPSSRSSHREHDHEQCPIEEEKEARPAIAVPEIERAKEAVELVRTPVKIKTKPSRKVTDKVVTHKLDKYCDDIQTSTDNGVRPCSPP